MAAIITTETGVINTTPTTEVTPNPDSVCGRAILQAATAIGEDKATVPTTTTEEV
jgi:hypothetical protein